jgi:hypothetical protein
MLTDAEIDVITDKQWDGIRGREIAAAHRAYAKAIEAAVLEKQAALAQQKEAQPIDFDTWSAHPYTKVLERSIAEDYVPKEAQQCSTPEPWSKEHMLQGELDAEREKTTALILECASLEHERDTLKEAQQEPVAWTYKQNLRDADGSNPKWCREVLLYSANNDAEGRSKYGINLYTATPSHTAVLRQALEALESLDLNRWTADLSLVGDAIAAIREQLGETK